MMWVRCDECSIKEYLDIDVHPGSPEGQEASDRWWYSHEWEAHR